MERERKGANWRKILPAAAVVTFFASLLVVGGTVAGTESKESGCSGKPNWDKGGIAFCLDSEGRVIAEDPSGHKRTLPDGVCELAQVWVKEGKVVWNRYYDHGRLRAGNLMDLETGETRGTGFTQTSAPYGLPDNEDPCKK